MRNESCLEVISVTCEFISSLPCLFTSICRDAKSRDSVSSRDSKLTVLVLVLPLLYLTCVSRARQFKTPGYWQDALLMAHCYYPLAMTIDARLQRLFHLIRLHSYWSHPLFSDCHWPEADETSAWRHFGFCLQHIWNLLDKWTQQTSNRNSKLNSF